jgi:hypothetical protein
MIRPALAVLALAGPAAAHDWYPWACCSDKDCAPVAVPADLRATPQGWHIPASGETIPFEDPRIRLTPPEGGGEFHRCSVAGDPAARTICLFVPVTGS